MSKVNFFTELFSLLQDKESIELKVQRTCDELTVLLVPKIKGKTATITICGSPEDLNEGFMEQLTIPVEKIKGLVSNAAEVKIEDADDSDEEVVVNEDNVPHLPCFDEWASLYAPPKPSENTPSCSLAEALEKQDLLINSSLANAGMQLLWRLFREGKTPYSGVIINLDSLTSNPIRV